MNTVIRYINHFLINLVVYENESTINKRGNKRENINLFFFYLKDLLLFGLLGFYYEKGIFALGNRIIIITMIRCL